MAIDRTEEMWRLVRAIQPLVNRHIEEKVGPGRLSVTITPGEMKELRSAYEPFRKSDSERMS